MERVPILSSATSCSSPSRSTCRTRACCAAGRPRRRRVATGARGVMIDISAVEIVDSFIGRMLATIAVDVAGARRPDRASSACGPRSPSRWSSSACRWTASHRARSRRRASRCSTRSSRDAWHARHGRAADRTDADVVRVRQQVRGGRGEPGCPSSTRPRWSPPPASWPATRWSTAAAGRPRIELVTIGQRPRRHADHLHRRGPRHPRRGPGADRRLDHRHGLGLGLSGARRLVDEFKLVTEPGEDQRHGDKWSR